MVINYLFGIGFNRSGTLSLTQYFQSLNIKTIHWNKGRVSQQIKENYQQNRPLLTGFENWNGFFDLEHFDVTQPMGYYKSYQKHYQLLNDQYPLSMFVFNFRKCDYWINSLLHHPVDKFVIMEKIPDVESLFQNRSRVTTLEYIQWISKLSVYDIVQKLKKEYEQHFLSVLEYFDQRSNLILFDLDQLDKSLLILNSKLKIESNSFPKCNQGNKYRFSVMICCMDRTDHLKQTLNKNLLDNLPYSDWMEFVIVHYWLPTSHLSDESFRNWIYQNYQSYLDSGYLKYFINHDFTFWRAGACRNTGFWYTKGSIIYNLDSDNYLGDARIIVSSFDKYGENNIIFLGFNGVFSDGSFGRICLSRENHFKLNSYDYHLPTIWSHDDSLLLLKALYKLNLNLIAPDRDFPIMFISKLAQELGYTQLIRNFNFEIIENNEIIPHSGVSHARDESFKTIEYNKQEIKPILKQILDNDLKIGFQYIKKNFPNILNLFDSNISTQDDNKIKNNQFWTLKSYLSEYQHNKIIYCLEYNNDFDLNNISIPNQINIVIISKPEYYFPKNNVIWLYDNFGFSELKSEFHILVKLTKYIIISNNDISLKIVQILNASQSNKIEDTNNFLTVLKYPSNDKIIYYDFLLNGDISINTLKSNNNPQKFCEWLSQYTLIVWGNPTDFNGLNIGYVEKNTRQQIVKSCQDFIDVCKQFGMDIKYLDDRSCHNINLTNCINTIILTYGLFCYNHNIPISKHIQYIIWQPDIRFNINYFPIDQTRIISYNKKTKYTTFLINNKPDYVNFLYAFLKSYRL